MGNRETQFFEHFPQDISDEIRAYATDEVLSWSRYLFTHREGRHQYAFCTHCKQYHKSEGLRHGMKAECEQCGTEAKVRASGRGRSRLIDEAYLLWYEKSQVNDQAIIARGFYLVRDYTGDYHKTETLVRPIALYLFEPGIGGKMAYRYYWRDDAAWYFPKNIRSEAVHSMRNKACFWARHSARKAVNGTPFQYCTWEQYEHEDHVKVFDFAAKYPCMEYLTKLGMSSAVSAKIAGQRTFGAINWRGKSIDKVLRLTKAEAKEWVKQPYKGGLLSLYAYQLFTKKLGFGFSFEQAHQLCSLADKERFHEVLKLRTYAPIKEILLYLLKQLKRGPRHTPYVLLGDWRDYLAECGELGMDLSQESVMFPNDLHEAHQKTSAKVKFKRDQALNAKIVKRAKELDKQYRFEHNGLLIRPAASNKELFDEGKSLNHCVGGYAQRYADGQTDILVVRKASDPDKPFYTMEVRERKVVQCRGLRNCDMTPEVRAFVQAFVEEKLQKKKARVKVAVRQEVAV